MSIPISFRPGTCSQNDPGAEHGGLQRPTSSTRDHSVKPEGCHHGQADDGVRARGGLTLKPTYVAFLDDQVAYYYNTLPKGTFDLYFRTRASTLKVLSSSPQPAPR